MDPADAAVGERAGQGSRTPTVPGGRRTVQIKGQPVAPRRRSPAAAQFSARPDRVAMWAVMLGLFLVFMAVVTAAPS